MYNRLGDDFKFVATEPIDKERLRMGYADMSELYPFSLNTYSSKEKFCEGINLGIESDVVITGSAPELFIKNRLIENKLTFRYSERIFKKGQWRGFRPRTLYSLYKYHTKYKNNRLYMLCASAYTACDFNLVSAYKDKTYKWGYFPEVKQYDIEDLLSKKKKSVQKLLWAGRFLDWKHPEHAILVANMLKKEGYNFTLDFIGTGDLEDHLRNLIEKYNLYDRVNMLGSMKPKEVREHMESANIYLFTSDFNEGWGAVLNESMNSGCAVVASHAIGSVPFLMKNGKNGFIYKNGDIQDLFNCTKRLLDDSELCEQLGREAYKTLEGTWNAKIVAERFIKLANGLLKDENMIFQDGPCSKAEIIKQRYIY
jgi:glycosyltransferase involved in cell wall biosynthesis